LQIEKQLSLPSKGTNTSKIKTQDKRCRGGKGKRVSGGRARKVGGGGCLRHLTDDDRAIAGF